MACALRPNDKLKKLVDKQMNIKESKDAYYKPKREVARIEYYYQGSSFGTPPNNGIGPMY